MFNFLKALFLSISFGGPKREVVVRFSPFEWKLNRHAWTDNPALSKHVLNIGPFMFLFRTAFALAILITGSIAASATPPWTGTPPNAIYRQPVQITRYQPGVRTYYRSQHVQVPGFGTIITNEYRHAQTYQRKGRIGSGQSGSHNHGKYGQGSEPFQSPTYYRRQ